MSIATKFNTEYRAAETKIDTSTAIREVFQRLDKSMNLDEALEKMTKYDDNLKQLPPPLSARYNDEDKAVICSKQEGNESRKQSKRTQFGKRNKYSKSPVLQTIIPPSVEITFNDYSEAAKAIKVFAKSIKQAEGTDDNIELIEAKKISPPYPEDINNRHDSAYNIAVDSRSFLNLVEKYASEHCSELKRTLKQISVIEK